MSNREKVLELVENIPEEKLAFLITIIENMELPLIEDISPDELDLQMLKQADLENDGTTYTQDEVAEMLRL